ncbi:gamma-glutamylcyclotransferase [Herbaspirillum sp. GCM10030257]|uniref:gamma-glutamylcyclotransferase n=1 Tax=Herbaspirillum sp. GCM10030257 TaxID=3273393 RepID=UPI0036189479
MSLTEDLVALTCRPVSDSGPLQGVFYHSDDDYRTMVDAVLEAHPAGKDAWLFAFGSLIWKPECEYLEELCGIAPGWHRSFCFRIQRHRGTQEFPGLMMSLDRGGQCKGILFRLSGRTLREQLEKLCRREITVKPANTVPRWIKVVSGGKPLRAIAFVMNRQANAYVGKLQHSEIADILARACGHWGSGAEYLFHTVRNLEERGIHDRYLWQLQRLVAERIAANQHSLYD